ncbi:RNA polymerase sigma factor [bacterium]|nr:RNA polymerase sigma factor [bacterium]
MKSSPPTAGSASAVEVEDDRATDPAERIERAFARHQKELLGTLYHLIGNVEDAQDALQEAFVKCWRHREEIAHVECLRAWIYRVVLNTGRDLRQSAWKRKRRSMDEPTAEALKSSADDPATDTIRREEVAQLRQALLDLRPEEKEVFLLRENGDLTYEQMAEALGIPVGTVKTRMRAALARLRGVLGVSPA